MLEKKEALIKPWMWVVFALALLVVLGKIDSWYHDPVRLYELQKRQEMAKLQHELDDQKSHPMGYYKLKSGDGYWEVVLSMGWNLSRWNYHYESYLPKYEKLNGERDREGTWVRFPVWDPKPKDPRLVKPDNVRFARQ